VQFPNGRCSVEEAIGKQQIAAQSQLNLRSSRLNSAELARPNCLLVWSTILLVTTTGLNAT